MSKLGIPDHRQRLQKTNCDEEMALEKWRQLEAGIDQIYRRSRSSLSFQTMFTNAFQLVKHGYGKLVYTQLEQCMRSRISEQCDLISAATDSNLLKVLTEQWGTHFLTTERTADVLMHLDRQYCVAAPIKPIRVLGQTLFGEIVLKKPELADRLRTVFLKIVEGERSGDEVPSHNLKGISQMLISIDRREVFENIVEKPFLRSTMEFYRDEASRLISLYTTPMFVAAFWDRLEQERSRVRRCLDDYTLSKVEDILRQQFLVPHEASLLSKAGSGIEELLKGSQISDIRNLYDALWFAGDVSTLIRQTAQYFLKEGIALVTDKEVCANAVLFVEKLIELKTKMDTLIRDAFSGEGRNRMVEVELNRAFEEVANKNDQTSEHLSTYFDSKLKSADVEDFDRCCENVIGVYKVLRDKDHFENAYKIHLSRRLLSPKQVAHEEQERLFIDKLKREFGASATSKLEGMFADKRSSEELMDDFRKRLESRGERLPVELSVSVLTSGFWPQTPNASVPLPGELERCSAVFRNFYLARHKGRRLDYQFGLGAVDVKMNISRRYDVNLPLQSLPVLLMFQGDESFTITEIANRLGNLAVPEAVRLCAALTRTAATHTGVLKVQGGSHNTLAAGSSLCFNKEFKSKHLKVRLNAVTMVKEKEATTTSSDNRNRLDEDRKYKVEAAIVRIMKSRRTLEHRVLVNEVTNVLKNSFCPQPEEIKRRIEHLIEREFLERTPDARGHYNYLA